MICESCGLSIQPDERAAPSGCRHASVNLCVVRLHAEVYALRGELSALAHVNAHTQRCSERYATALTTIQGCGTNGDFSGPLVDKRILTVVNAALRETLP